MSDPLSAMLGMATGAAAAGRVPSHFKPRPPWVVLATFGPDENGIEYAVARVFGQNRVETMRGMLSTLNVTRSDVKRWESLIDSLVEQRREPLVFVVLKRDPSSSLCGPRACLDGIFMIELGPPGAQGRDTHWLGELVMHTPESAWGHGFKMDNTVYAVMLWTLTEVFGFDPDSMFIGVQFGLGIPDIVKDGALDRFQAMPQTQDFNEAVSRWQELKERAPEDLDGAWISAFEELEQALCDGAESMLMELDKLHPKLVWVDDPDTFPIRDAEGCRWQLDIEHREPVMVKVYFDGRVEIWSEEWDVVLSQLADDLPKALVAAHLIVEESQQDAWWKRWVDRQLPGPGRDVLGLDIEAYLLLDKPTPYMLPDHDFIDLLRAEGLL
jgi:hypothetical protein